MALPFESLRAAVDDDAPRKRGGFQGTATPKPAAKKTADSEETPAPKKKPASEATPSPKKKTASDSTPAPKKKRETDEPSTEKKSETSNAPEEKEKGPATASQSTHSKKKSTAGEEPAEETKSETSKTTAKQSAASDPENGASAPVKPERAPAATLEPEDLAEFSTLQPRTQELITAALALTKLNLTYTYGSDDPARGGMDCSGAMAYLLRGQGFKDVPRDSSSQYIWARKAGPFFAVVSKSAESFEFKELRPGDLLFWTGTYETGREVPISHVMLYLGTEKKTKKRVMFGSSDGRSYAGIQRWGVSVFDFKMPRSDPANPEKSKVDFVGYGRIPALATPELAEVKTETTPPASAEEPEAKPEPVVKKPVTSKKPTTSKKKRSSSAAKE